MTSSDYSVCAFMVKNESAEEGLVNTLCSSRGDENEHLEATWVESDISDTLAGDLNNYS